jgi:hypothetical protein
MSMTPRPNRIPAEIPVDVLSTKTLASSRPAASARVVDLHAGGIGIAHRYLNVDEGDVVLVQFPSFLGSALTVCGTVRWWRPDRIGIEVDKMGPHAMERYEQLVREVVVEGYAEGMPA